MLSGNLFILAMFSQQKRDKKDKIAYIIIFCVCSNERGILFPFNPMYDINPGGTEMLGKEALLTMEKSAEKEEASPSAQEVHTCNLSAKFKMEEYSLKLTPFTLLTF